MSGHGPRDGSAGPWNVVVAIGDGQCGSTTLESVRVRLEAMDRQRCHPSLLVSAECAERQREALDGLRLMGVPVLVRRPRRGTGLRMFLRGLLDCRYFLTSTYARVLYLAADAEGSDSALRTAAHLTRGLRVVQLDRLECPIPKED